MLSELQLNCLNQKLNVMVSTLKPQAFDWRNLLLKANKKLPGKLCWKVGKLLIENR